MNRMDRRTFLQGLGAAVAVGAVGAPSLALGAAKKVVIVGGGTGGQPPRTTCAATTPRSR